MPLPDLRDIVRRSARKGVDCDVTIGVALSGGVDSIVLLDVLHTMREDPALPILAIHVNHGLSPNADSWERFCASECGRRGIAFESVRVKLSPAPGDSLEAIARTARREALATIALRHRIRTIALAHHQDDQAETVLLQLLRGASVRGLAAMAELRAGPRDVALWRPLLHVPRESILEYARANGLAWIEDESNSDVRFRRNHLRHRVLPAIGDAFGGYRSGLARAALRAAEAAQLLDALADLDAPRCASGDGLALSGLRELGALRAQNVLRRTLAARGVSPPDADRLAEFVRQSFSAGSARSPSLTLDSRRRIVCTRGQVRLLPGILGAPYRAQWQGESEILLPHGVLRFTRTSGRGFASASVPERGFAIRPREGGERCRLAPNRPSRTLANLLQEAGIAAPLRDDWPLVVDGESVVAVPGIGVGVDWQCPPDEAGWSVDWEAATA